ncbi:hypothetical protein FWF93_00690 [Candidatus Saccharibacteria bacterium]|nr:hypothetical protein [Candidatus Saccharibacteria bacterium]
MKEEKSKKSGLVTAGFVLGIVAIATSFIPIINNASIVLGALAAIFGVVGLVKRAGAKAVVTLILGVISVAIAISMQISLSNSLDKLSEDINNVVEEAAQSDINADEIYDKIVNGMTKDEVSSAVGREIGSCSESSYEISDVTYTTETCSYGNALAENGYVSVTFSDGKVSSKYKN